MKTGWWFTDKSAGMDNPLLQVKDLTIQSPKKTLVEKLSFTIEKGEVYGLVGESGSGKTLTALSLSGILPHAVEVTSGEALLETSSGVQDLYTMSAAEIRKVRGAHIGMIFQEPMTALNPSMRCGPQAAESLVLKGIMKRDKARSHILQLFQEVELKEPERIYNAWPHQLSGGQKQRVIIAMALAASPDLIIADEPTTALDVTVQKSILALLRKLQKRYQLGVLFITHDLLLLGEIAHRVGVLQQGKLVETGTAAIVLQSPKHLYSQALLAAREAVGASRNKVGTSMPNMNSQPEVLFSVKGLKVSYGRGAGLVQAVKGVDFDIYRGETLGLVGESGSGKTSIGRALLKLLQQQEGGISYAGTELRKMSERNLRQVRKEIQLVFQDPYASLNPRKTIREILAEPILFHKLRKRTELQARLDQLMQEVGLEPTDLNNYPHQFSGGQRQRICIARALACEPKFVVLDESVSALDVTIQGQVLQLLNELKARHHLTYLFISHDLLVVKAFSDRVMVMESGELIEAGSSEELFQNPAMDYTRKLIEAIPGKALRENQSSPQTAKQSRKKSKSGLEKKA